MTRDHLSAYMCALASSALVGSFFPRLAAAQTAEQLNEIAQSSAAPAPAASPKEPAKLFNPDDRRFLAPSAFATWAGTERVMDGELSLATPRPWADNSLLPALDNHLSTTAYAGYSHEGIVKGGPDWNLVELSSLHDLKPGPVLGVNLRADVRQTTALQGSITGAIPLPAHLALLPSLGVGEGSDFVPGTSGSVEVRSDENAPRDYALGVDASAWTYGRARVLGRIGTVQRLSPKFALEGRVALGAWAGPLLGGNLALQWSSSALQTLSDRFGVYERVTLTRGAAEPAGTAPPSSSATFVDGVVGARWAATQTFGLTLQAGGGGEGGGYGRWGLDLTLYGKLF